MNNEAVIELRNTLLNDAEEIAGLLRICRPVHDHVYPMDALRSPILKYPQGQFIVRFEGKVVGYCSTFRINKNDALKPRDWDDITGYGFAALHDPVGEFLYCIDLCVHPDYLDLKIDSRMEQARKRLCQEESLKGMVTVCRIPNYARQKKHFASPKEYINAIIKREVIEPELSNKLQAQYQFVDFVENYYNGDESGDAGAVLLVWYNPSLREQDSSRNKARFGSDKVEKVRVALVQYMLRPIASYDEFVYYVEYFVKSVSNQNADFVLFPELFTLQLLTIQKKAIAEEHAILVLTEYTARITKTMRLLAIKYNINIIAGSHLSLVDNKVHNISSVYLRNGEIHQQYKLHFSKDNHYRWGVQGGSNLNIIDTDCGPIAVLISYDCEFPELARIVAEQGARIIFVPFSVTERHCYLRLRYCAQARAVENQCFVALAGNVGNLPGVANIDVQYAQSSIFTPSDFAFSRDGIAVDTPVNAEMVAYADLSMTDLDAFRYAGGSAHLKERRTDLYTVQWLVADKN